MYPKILDLGPFTIHTYGVMLALAFIAGIWLTCRNAKGKGDNKRYKSQIQHGGVNDHARVT